MAQKLYIRIFFAVLFMKAIKLDITQILINRKISGVLIHGVLHNNGNEGATVTCKNMDECRDTMLSENTIPGTYFIKPKNKQK